MCRRWKFDQLKTWLHMIIFSCRIMKKHVSFDSKMSFMRFRWKCVFAIRGEKVCLMEFDERKSFEVGGKNALSLRKKWEVWVFILRKVFLTQQALMEWQILKTKAKSSLHLKISSKTLTLGFFSLSPKLNDAKQDHRVKNGGLYRIG